MGYGKKWTEEKVKDEIFKVMNALGIERMPSRSEVEMVTKNSALTNKIAKNGGFYHWAEKLGLDIKGSETSLGIQKEHEIKQKLKSLGHSVDLTPIKFPYDLLVDDEVKVDVKFSEGYSYKHGFYYSFNLEYDLPKCDILVLICGSSKILVVPAYVFTGLKQVSVGVKSKYDKYKDQWFILNQYRTSQFVEMYLESRQMSGCIE